MQLLRRKIGGFYTVEHIGSGGMSQVYLAVNPRTKEKRAVKILRRRATAPASELARFGREIQIIGALKHPNIVRILDAGVEDDFYYYMMEHMAGGSLARRLSHGRLALADALRLFSKVVAAMACAHGHGVVHRDLKPANILLTEDGEPMVSDFGIAKTLGSGQTSLTMSNEILGTIAYLAPEQRVSSKRVDRRADVFALGAILYECLMGFPPLGKFPWPSETQPSFPGNVERMLERCLAIDPEKRFADATELCSETERVSAALGIGPSSGSRAGLEGTQPACDAVPGPGRDRVEGWLEVLRHGSTRERLNAVREMVEHMEAHEVQSLLKLYTSVEQRVRWGLIRVFGERRVSDAVHLVLAELQNPFHRECAIEALGKIASPEAFGPILNYIRANPQSAPIALTPLALTGQHKAVRHLRQYLQHEWSTVRLSAVRALASVPIYENLKLLREHVLDEKDEKVRAAVFQAIRSLESAISSSQDPGRGDTVVLRRAQSA